MFNLGDISGAPFSELQTSGGLGTITSILAPDWLDRIIGNYRAPIGTDKGLTGTSRAPIGTIRAL